MCYKLFMRCLLVLCKLEHVLSHMLKEVCLAIEKSEE